MGTTTTTLFAINARLVAFGAMLLAFASHANAALVLHLPLNDASSGAVTTAAAAVNDGTHPTTFGTSTGNFDMWANDATRGNVYFNAQGSRLTAGTQGIDRAVGFTWSIWFKADSTATGNADSGAETIIGTRQASGGAWHKVGPGTSSNWAGVTGLPAAGTLFDNTWQHLVYMGDSTNVRAFLNGVAVGTPDATTPTTTFSGAFEIGGSSQFAEDTEGFFNDVGVWDEALTANEVKGFFDVSSASPGLLYDVGDFNALKQVHDTGTGSVMIGGLTWTYATGLTGSAGLSGSGSNYTLVLDAAADTGLTAVPEPQTIALSAVGFLFVVAARRRRVG